MIFGRIKQRLLNAANEETNKYELISSQGILSKAGNFLKTEIYDDLIRPNTSANG